MSDSPTFEDAEYLFSNFEEDAGQLIPILGYTPETPVYLCPVFISNDQVVVGNEDVQTQIQFAHCQSRARPQAPTSMHDYLGRPLVYGNSTSGYSTTTQVKLQESPPKKREKRKAQIDKGVTHNVPAQQHQQQSPDLPVAGMQGISPKRAKTTHSHYETTEEVLSMSTGSFEQEQQFDPALFSGVEQTVNYEYDTSGAEQAISQDTSPSLMGISTPEQEIMSVEAEVKAQTELGMYMDEEDLRRLIGGLPYGTEIA